MSLGQEHGQPFEAVRHFYLVEEKAYAFDWDFGGAGDLKLNDQFALVAAGK